MITISLNGQTVDNTHQTVNNMTYQTCFTYQNSFDVQNDIFRMVSKVQGRNLKVRIYCLWALNLTNIRCENKHAGSKMKNNVKR